jgi:hypothetical protein
MYMKQTVNVNALAAKLALGAIQSISDNLGLGGHGRPQTFFHGVGQKFNWEASLYF